MLALLVREPIGYMSPEVYARLSDYQITEVYLAPRDDKSGRLVTFFERHRFDDHTSPRKFLSKEQLGVHPKALLQGVPMDFVLMFWTVWRERGKEPAWIWQRFQDYLKREHGNHQKSHR